MGWFQKHLNWMIIIITICSHVISYYVIDLIMDITHIHYWGLRYPSGITEIFLPVFSSFSFDAYLLLTTVLSIIGFSWVLRNKNRRWTYQIYFIVFLIFELPDFLSYLIELPRFVEDLAFLRFVAVILWLIGWIILLALKNKSVQPIGSGANNS